MGKHVVLITAKRATFVALLSAVVLGATLASAATFTVTNLNDEGPGSLRKALNDADGDDTITLDVTGTIVVKNLPLATSASNITIVGPGAGRLSISGNDLVPVLSIGADAIVTISGVTIRDGNSTVLRPVNARGAGIYNYGDLTLNDCAVINNRGGGIESTGTIQINRCTIARNTASSGLPGEYQGISRAAGIVAVGGTISHSTIADNQGTNDERVETRAAVLAGGLATYGSLKVTGCTIAGNSVDGATEAPMAGGIANLSIDYSPLITDSIIATNTAPNGGDCARALRSGGYNLIGDKGQSTGIDHGLKGDQVGGAGAAVIDPKLGPLANNGGTTPTMALLEGSPAIDRGLSTLPTDQRGMARRVDFAGVANAEGGDASDVGAFELGAATGALLNISTRAQVEQNDRVLIGGFIISGNDPARVLVRAIGPSLGSQGVQGALQNPTLELFEGSTFIAGNDDWKQDQQAEIEASGAAPGNDAESAIVRTLGPGSYTAIVRGVNDETGIALVEAYDLDQSMTAALANLSTRAFVQTDEKVLIGGIIIGPAGNNASRVLVRALGPSLSGAGVSEALQDPTLALVDGNGSAVAANDDWKQTQEAEIAATGIQPGDDREAALVRQLAPGNYTAVVRGQNEGTGVGSVEVYNLQ